MSEQERSAMPSDFDRIIGALDGLPDVVMTQPSTKRIVPPLGVGGTQLYAIQTIRQGEKHMILFEHVSNEATVRLVIPHEIAEIIARQRESVSVMLRKRLAKQTAANRKAAGWKPSFPANMKRGGRRVAKRGGKV